MLFRNPIHTEALGFREGDEVPGTRCFWHWAAASTMGTINYSRSIQMSLHDTIHTTLRSTGFVTNGQASDLAELVEDLIFNREAHLNKHVEALKAQLEGLHALISTAQEDTDKMDAEAYTARAVATFAAISSQGLLLPVEMESLPAAGPKTARVVIDCRGPITISDAYSDHPLDIVVIVRPLSEEGVAKNLNYMERYCHGVGKADEIADAFEEAEAAS
ncbi:hypothetical protein PVE_R2G0611 [Pseudomonas veronii 1YdBTEX2]|uniref:Uncharacterized protein n=1 Tax=Pseudomonas veronii 1YdBTEX2 TaxID=1295141 RepID=A0A1D3K8J3_PSEVE|nr:hypothetical protein PVE_R2G0611 [Pseudomonas veronii 1YdBTEX2]